MSLTLLLLQVAFLVLLWFFVFAVVYSLRADLFGVKARKLPEPAAAQAPAGPVVPASSANAPTAAVAPVSPVSRGPEKATASTVSTPEHHKFGTVGRALPGVELKIAEDGEVLVRGANVFQGYWRNADASFGSIDEDGWLHTGDLGSLDEDGYLSITGRKKDIIITAGGKNLTPANLENDLKQSRWISQAVMHGDRRPFPSMLITLDEETIVPWAQEQGIEDTSIAALAQHPQVIALIQEEVDRANARYAQVEQVKKFFILDHDFSQETGELTASLKVKRNVVNELYAERFDALYAD